MYIAGDVTADEVDLNFINATNKSALAAETASTKAEIVPVLVTDGAEGPNVQQISGSSLT